MHRRCTVVALVLIAGLYPHLAWAQGDGGAGDAAAALVSLVFSLVVGVVALAIMVGIAYLLYLCLDRIPQPFRQLEPWKAFLLLIPCFNLFWNFMVYPPLARSYQAYFQSVGRTDVGDCGEKIGLWYSIAAIGGLIPLVNIIAGPAALVLLIVYLVKAYQLRGQIPEKVSMA